MFWLVIQMWTLMLAAYILGLGSGWILKRRPAGEPAFDGATVYDDYPPDTADHQTATDHITEARTLNTEYHEQAKIHENPPGSDTDDIDQHDESGLNSDGLRDLPDIVDLSVNDKPEEGEEETETKSSSKPAQAPKLFSAPMQGPADDLKKIKGIGPTLERTLNATGIYYFDQIALWTEEEVDWINNRIDFPGRVERERWVAQAEFFASQAPNSQADSQETPDDKDNDSDAAPTDHTMHQDVADIESLAPADQVPEKAEDLSRETTESAPAEEEVPMTMMDKLMAQKRKAQEQ